ncbi:MAG: glutamate-cysteine ligase family protein [Acidimicrobiales bacterium]
MTSRPPWPGPGGRRPPRLHRDLLGQPQVILFARASSGRAPTALRPAGRRDAVDGAPAADLRGARPRRRRSGEEKAIVVANAVANRIHLLALTASSPFWEATTPGLASTRSKVFEGLPTAGLPADLADWADFEQYMSTLVAAGAVAPCARCGGTCDPTPTSAPWSCGCATASTMGEVASVAALAQALVAHIDRRHDERGPGPPARLDPLREQVAGGIQPRRRADRGRRRTGAAGRRRSSSWSPTCGPT